ncbi:MAG: 50S ribosomal protein L35 [Chloroflexi bacterium]|nr:50S ribosomal protein L35 [Chloroflexota bacterium]
MAAKKKTKKYKLKTHKATAKRFRVTGSGKIMRTQGPKSHLRRKKSKRLKRRYDSMVEVTQTASQKRIQRLAPYLARYNSRPSRPGSSNVKTG